MEKAQKSLNDKEIRILEAAGLLFARYGLKKTSIDEIAQQAGLGKGTIYLYFKSKEELFAKIVEGFGERLIYGLEQAIARSATPADQLRDFVCHRLQFLADRVSEAGLSCEVMKEFEDTETSLPLAPIVLGFRARQLELLEGIIREGTGRSQMRCEDPHLTAMAILSALEGYSRFWAWEPWQRETLAAKQDVICQLFLRGLGAPP